MQIKWKFLSPHSLSLSLSTYIYISFYIYFLSPSLTLSCDEEVKINKSLHPFHTFLRDSHGGLWQTTVMTWLWCLLVCVASNKKVTSPVLLASSSGDSIEVPKYDEQAVLEITLTLTSTDA